MGKKVGGVGVGDWTQHAGHCATFDLHFSDELDSGADAHRELVEHSLHLHVDDRQVLFLHPTCEKNNNGSLRAPYLVRVQGAYKGLQTHAS